ncbi:MAG: preprotein translocase subunit SecE [Lachnospiraceae bacterium]|nr:preprotein translocase subunit SecE [Lachnospiraceae bacterium]MBR7021812.1 preprotein translocase subunit SecE [Lachnospiraceae bacterium]
MSDTANAPAKSSWWKGLKAEWKKIVWPSRNTLAKESAAVVIITVILGLLIKLVDLGVEQILGFILK